MRKTSANSMDESLIVALRGRWEIQDIIGFGSFGAIHRAIDVKTKEQVAIKIELSNSKHPQLHHEQKCYHLLSGVQGIPRIYYFNAHAKHNVLVMEMLGPSLEELFIACGSQFTVPTVLLLAKQMITRLKLVHAKYIIHRDIKPENFVMGLDSEMVCLIDFGLSKLYYDPKTKKHIPYRENKSLIGTARYASLNAHRGVELCCRDDLESLGYVFMYFLRGSLPWQGLRATTKHQKYERIFEKKSATSVENLCKDYPSEFSQYLNYCRNLHFGDLPDYKLLLKLFTNSPLLTPDSTYDWLSLKAKRAIVKQPVVSADESRRKLIGSLEAPPLLTTKLTKHSIGATKTPLDYSRRNRHLEKH